MQKNILIAVIITTVIAGGAGYMFGKKAAANNLTAVQGQNGGGNVRGNFAGAAGRGARGGGGVVGGEIIAKDASSITVQLRGNQTDGAAGSKIVFFSDATQVMKSTSGTMSDLSVGTQVTAMGTANADGSVSAQSIQIRPQMPDDRASSTAQ